MEMEAKQSDENTVVSRKSSRSSASSTSSVIPARAKAEAAKARLAFADEEAKAKIERAAKEAKASLVKAKMDAELETLALWKEAAAAAAEAAMWKAADVQENYVLVDEAGPSEEEKMQRTRDYVQSQTSAQPLVQAASYTSFSEHQAPVHPRGPDPSNLPSAKVGSGDVYGPPAVKVEAETPYGERELLRNTRFSHNEFNENQRTAHPQFSQAAKHDAPATEHLARYLARRDLLSSCLYQFDDKPENFRAWKSSYNNATLGLGLTAIEELDLMTRWLGRESGEYVKRLRSAHITNPATALRKAWERLEEYYAAPEVIEKSLLTDSTISQRFQQRSPRSSRSWQTC